MAKRYQLQVDAPKFIPVVILPHNYGKGERPYFLPVTRITKNFIFTKVNDIAETKWSRETGIEVPRPEWTYSHIECMDLTFINHLANANGGTWDGGWKPKKSD